MVNGSTCSRIESSIRTAPAGRPRQPGMNRSELMGPVETADTGKTLEPPSREKVRQDILYDQRVIERILDCIDPQPGQRLVEFLQGWGHPRRSGRPN